MRHADVSKLKSGFTQGKPKVVVVFSHFVFILHTSYDCYTEFIEFPYPLEESCIIFKIETGSETILKPTYFLWNAIFFDIDQYSLIKFQIWAKNLRF